MGGSGFDHLRCRKTLLSALDFELDGIALGERLEPIHAEDNAGAVLTPDSLAKAAGRNLDAKKMLADNDGYSFFSGLGDLVITGPTLTNVNDFRAILIT